VQERVTVYEAAKRLGITEGALRQRIHRGKLETDKDEAGRVFVYLTPDITGDSTVSDSVKTPQASDLDSGLLDELRDRIRFLEEELSDRKEEMRRKDTLLAQMNHTLSQMASRIPELEVAPEPRDSPVHDSEDTSKGDDVPNDASEAKIRQSWWQRWFGVSARE
jgi:predicted phage gp36 major capsid-like protein